MYREAISLILGRRSAYFAMSAGWHPIRAPPEYLAEHRVISSWRKEEYWRKEAWLLSIRFPISLRGGLSKVNMRALCCWAMRMSKGIPRSPSPSPSSLSSLRLASLARLRQALRAALALLIWGVWSDLSMPLICSMSPPASISTWLSLMSPTWSIPAAWATICLMTTRSTTSFTLSWLVTYWQRAEREMPLLW